jgi:hypothetical protein
MSIEAMKLALEALEDVQDSFGNTSEWFKERVDGLRQAIEQAEQAQPVAWQWLDTAHFRKHLPKDAEPGVWRPLYAAPTAPVKEQT